MEYVTSYFGYPTYNSYRRTVYNSRTRSRKAARIVRHVTAREVWSKERHDNRIYQELIMSGRLLRLVTNVIQYCIKNNLANNTRIKSIGWYFEHPVTQKHIHKEYLDWYNTNCYPLTPNC